MGKNRVDHSNKKNSSTTIIKFVLYANVTDTRLVSIISFFQFNDMFWCCGFNFHPLCNKNLVQVKYSRDYEPFTMVGLELIPIVVAVLTSQVVRTANEAIDVLIDNESFMPFQDTFLILHWS
jgi:hypothetical protein